MIFEIVSFGLICLGAIIVVLVVSYESDKSTKENPTITFEQFKNLYAVAPDKWELKDEWVWYIVELYDGRMIEFKTAADLRKYKKWKQKLDNEQLLKKNNKLYGELIIAWTKDIEDYREQTTKAAQESLERIWGQSNK